ncbi:MAG: YfhO family protein [Mucilaginibacter sp.]
MNNWFKRNGIHVIIAVILVIIAYAYFFTPLMQGKVLPQGDIMRAQATQKEIMDTHAKTGHYPLWTNSMFGGMPAYQIWMSPPNNITTYVQSGIKAIFPNPIDTLLIYLLGAYLLFCVLKINPWLAGAGALAFTFSSYNFILIEAGHANQAYAIAFFAPIIAGVILTLRGKYLLGGSLTAFFLAMELRADHIQMTYYLFLALIVLVIVELYHAIKDKNIKPFGTAILYLAVAAGLAIMVNASLLWTTSEYAKESTRGQSNLTQHTSEPSTGLSKDYAYAWSQGVGECFTFLVPNAYGGASNYDVFKNHLQDANVTKAFIAQGASEEQAEGTVPALEQFGMTPYWGNKPFTGGPFYFGAIICFLFILGLLIVKNRIKWWLLITVILTMLLSFGKNWPYISDLFFNYFPMYNKFRVVESILAVTMLCFPMLAFMAVQEIINNKDKKWLFKKVLIAFYIVGGLLVILIAVPGIFLSFRSDPAGVTALGQAMKGNTAFADAVNNGLIKDREDLERADAFRSLIFVAIAFGLIWAFVKQKINVTVASVALLLLTLVDMWGVDRRFLSDDTFTDKQETTAPQPRQVDQIITRDSDPDFRVIDLSQGSPFTNASTSYFYKSIGGYHAAKLKRFDELIDMQFSKSLNQDVLDMLNTKYIITADPKSGEVGMRANETACGHAWFVKSVKYVDNADQEMQAITSFDPKNEAIVDKKYKSMLDGNALGIDPNATITLTSYQPEHLVYQTGSTSSQVAVFSEIYYKEGWKMLIDGKESPYFRADYLLRAAVIPVGNHKVEFVFHPASYYTGETISLAGSILLVLALGGAAYAENKRKKSLPSAIEVKDPETDPLRVDSKKKKK